MLTLEDLNAMPDHRFTRLSREQVLRMERLYVQAKVMRAYCDEVRARAVDMLVNGEGLTPLVERMMDAESMACGITRCPCGQDTAPTSPGMLPVPAYEKPVKRWAGGPPELDAWYFDRNAF
jgi:hypothetical protein